MSEICTTCGLPKELCVCGTIAKENLEIRISTEKRRFGKICTVIKGIEADNIDVKELAKVLKNKLACGGTFSKNEIELQGHHVKKAYDILMEQGFPPSSIKVR
jgi:translation initiation factor 1